MTNRKGKTKLIVFIIIITFFTIEIMKTTLLSEPHIQLTVEPSSVDFGNVGTGLSSEQTVAVTNSGNVTLIIGQITDPPEPFAINNDSCSGSVLAAKSFCTITLGFTPQTFVAYSTSLYIPYTEPTTQQQYSLTISLIGNGEGIGNSTGSSCLITTAARGSYLEPHVNVLRDFRDRYLLTNPCGAAFVQFYNRHSPAVAECIKQNSVLKTITIWLLTPLIYVIELLY
jgi:hypothetical protein